MDEGSVRRIHQPDDRMVDAPRRSRRVSTRSGAPDSSKPSMKRDFRRAGRVVAKKDPDVALHLARRVAAGMDAAGENAWPGHQRGDQRCSARRVEAPAMIAAFDLVPVETAGGERHAAVGTEVAQRKSRAGGVTADQDRLAEHDFRQHRAAVAAAALGTA